MPKIKIDKLFCKGCQLCIVHCPKGLIKMDNRLNEKGIRPVTFSGGKCTGCKYCSIICPDGAIEVFK